MHATSSYTSVEIRDELGRALHCIDDIRVECELDDDGDVIRVTSIEFDWSRPGEPEIRSVSSGPFFDLIVDNLDFSDLEFDPEDLPERGMSDERFDYCRARGSI